MGPAAFSKNYVAEAADDDDSEHPRVSAKAT
jgi:hypothetical protein